MLAHIDYCDIWGGRPTPSATVTKDLRLQKRAAGITFDDYVIPSKELIVFTRLKWLPLDSWIAHSKAALVYKSIHDLVTAYNYDDTLVSRFALVTVLLAVFANNFVCGDSAAMLSQY